jgi:hypothetical protein
MSKEEDALRRIMDLLDYLEKDIRRVLSDLYTDAYDLGYSVGYDNGKQDGERESKSGMGN